MAWGAVAGAAISVVGGAMLSDGDSGAAAANNAQSERLSRVQADIAEDQWDLYKRIYGPLEEEFVGESRGVGSIANQNKAAQQAAADVAGTFAGAREQLNETPGLNPNSDAYLRNANKINLAEAASSAAAQSGARQDVQAKGRAATVDALSLGKGLPASAGSMLATAGSGLRAAAQFHQRNADATADGFGRVVGGITSSKGFQDWIRGGSSSAPTVPPNPYVTQPIGSGVMDDTAYQGGLYA